MDKKEIRIIQCETEEQEKEIIYLLKKKYKNNLNCQFRRISDTFILPDKKWIVASKSLTKLLTKRNLQIKIYSMEAIKNALLKN